MPLEMRPRCVSFRYPENPQLKIIKDISGVDWLIATAPVMNGSVVQPREISQSLSRLALVAIPQLDMLHLLVQPP